MEWQLESRPPSPHRRTAQHGETRSRHSKAAPRSKRATATAAGHSTRTPAALRDELGKPLRPHGLGQTGHMGRILTEGDELDGSAGHQLCPEQRMNSKFLPWVSSTPNTYLVSE